MRKALPRRGQDRSTLEKELTALGEGDARWRDLRTAVFVFHPGDDVPEVAKSAYAMYQSENGLGAGSAYACVGGYFAPFARMNGADLPPFDFGVPGVRSISADLHKSECGR